ncbi:MAG TPA: DUF5668 domain-containing protein [Limnochordales bacterium]
MNQRIIGILLVALGVLALLHTLGVADAGTLIGTWWPLVLVLVGASQLRNGSPVGGAMVIAIGGAFFLRNLGVLPAEAVRLVWPLFLVAVGLYLLVGRRQGAARHKAPSVRLFTAFSGSTHRLESRELRGAELTVLFGGLDVDARHTEPEDDGVVVDVGVLAGGITLRVPETWRVVPEALVIFGGIEDKRPRASGSETDAPQLHIRGFVFMGGVEIQS